MKIKLIMIIITIGSFASCVVDPEIFENTNTGNFELLWKIIDTKYCYLDYKHIHWDSIHDVYAQQVNDSMDQYAFFDLMGNMLSELKDGHVNLYSDFDISRYWKWFTDSLPNFNSALIYSNRYLGADYRIAGGMRYNQIANNKVGYVYYGDFSSTFTNANMSNIFNYFSTCDGIILDVRDNGGGYLSQAEQLASYFFVRDTITGYISHKTGNGHNDFSKPVAVKLSANKTIKWEKPIIILSNRLSYSATNSFIQRMKMAPHALIIGDKSGGGGGLPLSSEIPNGWLIRFSACPMYDADMNHTEWGIDPDLKLNMDSTDMANGYDTLIERAIYYITH